MAKREVAFNELQNTIGGIKGVAVVRDTWIDELSKVVDSTKVKQVFDGVIKVSDLAEGEQVAFFKKMFQITSVKAFNPAVVFAEEKKSTGKKHRMFNADFKEEFIIMMDYNTQGEANLRMIFDKTEDVEDKYSKDVYEMNRKQLEEVFTSLKAKTVRSLQNYISKISQYVDYAIEQGKATENLVRKYDTKDKIEQFIDKKAEDNMIFDFDEIMGMAEDSDNAQDGVILSLIFDGVSYKDKYKELVDLTEDMVDLEEGFIHLPKRVEGENVIEARTIKMSDTTRRLVRSSIIDEEYLSITGDTERRYKLAESRYILRGVRKGREQINWRNINQRILRIADINDYEYLNATNISYSGQLHYAMEAMEKENLDVDTTVDKILKRFAFQVNTSSQFYLRSRIEKYAKLFRRKQA